MLTASRNIHNRYFFPFKRRYGARDITLTSINDATDANDLAPNEHSMLTESC
jgi:hypothetical protein